MHLLIKEINLGFWINTLENSLPIKVAIPSSPKFFKRIDDLFAMKCAISWSKVSK